MAAASSPNSSFIKSRFPFLLPSAFALRLKPETAALFTFRSKATLWNDFRFLSIDTFRDRTASMLDALSSYFLCISRSASDFAFALRPFLPFALRSGADCDGEPKVAAPPRSSRDGTSPSNAPHFDSTRCAASNTASSNWDDWRRANTVDGDKLKEPEICLKTTWRTLGNSRKCYKNTL